MNWISKFVIVLTCAFSLLVPPSPLAARSSSSDKPKTAKLQKLTPSTKAQRTSSSKQKAKPGDDKSTAAEQKLSARLDQFRQSAVLKSAQGRRESQAKTDSATASTSRGNVAKRSKSVILRSKSAKPQAVAQQRRPSRSTERTATAPGVAASSNTISQLITARSAMVMDAVTGEAIYAQASDTPAQPASTIKVLTGVISLDALPKNELVPVSRRAAMMPSSKVFLSPSKKYPANDLINAVLLASANGASVALAEKIAGSEQAFAQMMTAKAKSFGATNTVCKTANGLTANGQYTTAHDLAKIFNNAMRNSEFANKMAVTEVANTDGKIIRSHNRALWQVDGAEGGKTGYTVAARRTYVGKFKRDNDEIIVSLMGSESLWPDVKKLVEYGFAKKRENRGATANTDTADNARLAVQLQKTQKESAQTPAL